MSIDNDIELLESYRACRAKHMKKLQEIIDLHTRCGNQEYARDAQEEYDRLLHKDDKALDYLKELSAQRSAECVSNLGDD